MPGGAASYFSHRFRQPYSVHRQGRFAGCGGVCIYVFRSDTVRVNLLSAYYIGIPAFIYQHKKK